MRGRSAEHDGVQMRWAQQLSRVARSFEVALYRLRRRACCVRPQATRLDGRALDGSTLSGVRCWSLGRQISAPDAEWMET